MTSNGNKFNDFPENRLTKFRAVYTAKVNRKYWGTCPPDWCRWRRAS